MGISASPDRDLNGEILYFYKMRKTTSLLLLSLLIGSCGDRHPRILMETELGEITVEVYPDEAPATAYG